MIVLDGKKIADEKLASVRQCISASGMEAALAVVLVGNDPASELYVSLKKKTAEKIGIDVRVYRFADDTPRAAIAQCIAFLNADPETHGIIVQLPLPMHLVAGDIVGMIAPEKDVDGFHPENQEKFLVGRERYEPVFPKAIIELLQATDAALTGKSAVIIGKSDVFDRVMAAALSREKVIATFVRCEDIALQRAQIRTADIVITACGMPRIITADMVKDGAIVIDGGIVREKDSVVGDVDQSSFVDHEGFLSPVPGGVGPVTIACLLENVYVASRR